VAALAEVVLAGVDDERAAEDRVGADERDLRVLDVDVDVARAVGLDVAEVADVALRVGGAAVVLAVGVEVGAGRGAARREVAELVDVEAALGVGVEALDLGLAPSTEQAPSGSEVRGRKWAGEARKA
jgi:hypothetical protein